MVDPWLAFSPDNIPVPGLNEGIIFPEKEDGGIQGCLFSNRRPARELFAEARVSKEPVLVRVLVGTKRGIEKWLRLSGPASCALWIEVSEENVNRGLSQSISDEYITGHLKLAYRLRSGAANYLVVLKTIVVLSWYQKSQAEQEQVKYVESRSGLVCRWLLIMPSKAFRQLLCMIEPGGVLGEFQILLRQLVDSANFLDVHFRYLDLSFWLNRYPFVLSLDGSDLLLVTRDLKWTIVKFDCLEGVVQMGKSSGAMRNDVDTVLSDLLQVEEWRSLWDEASTEKDARRIGPLGSVVFNSFYIEGKGFIGGISVQESLDCIAESWKEAGKRIKYIFSIAGATIFELKASNLFSAVRLSIEEQSALSNLQSSSKLERQQGLNVLIDLLLGGENSDISPTASAASTSVRGLVPSARDSIINWNTFHEVDSVHVSSNKISGHVTAQRIGWMKLLEWVDRRFLATVLDEAVLDYEAVEGVKRAVDALLKVVDIIPGEASSELGAYCIEHLRTCLEKVRDLVYEFDIPEDREGEEVRQMSATKGEQKEPVKNGLPVKAFQELISVTNILSLVTRGSSTVAAVVAESGGLLLALEAFLELVKVFSLGDAGCKSDKADSEDALPGEIVINADLFRPFVGSDSFGAWQQKSNCQSELTRFTPELAFTSSRINAMLQAQRKGYISYDQSHIKKAFHSSGLAKVLMRLILRRVSTVKTLSLSAAADNIKSDRKLFSQKVRTVKLNLRSGEGCNGSLPWSVVLSFLSDAKYQLLTATAVMLMNKSWALDKVKRELLEKFTGQRRVDLVASLVSELLHILHHGLSEKVHEHILQVLFMLDKAREQQEPCPVQLVVQNSAFSVMMLSEVGAQLEDCLRRQKYTLNAERQVDQGVGFWMELASLMQVLTTFICKWPEEGAATLAFQCCRSQLEAVMDVIWSSGSSPSSWCAGRLLLMQNVLRLFGASMQRSNSTTQRELDDAVWKLLIDSKERWEFIRSYSQWIVFDACHECVWSLLEEYCWSIWEPLEVHDCSAALNVSTSWLPRWLPSFQCEEIPLKNLVSFLRLVVGLIQRKADRNNNDSKLVPGKTRSLLDFLMDPVNGLVMKLLKRDCLQNSQEQFEASYFHLKHVRQDLRNLIPFCTQRKGIYSSKVHLSGWNCGHHVDYSAAAVKDTAADWPYDLSYLAATNVEIAGLQLLASIFALNFNNRPELQRRAVFGNPFLSKKYAYPFLDFHFLRLIQLYYVNMLRVSSREPALQKVSEDCTLEWCIDGSSAAVLSEADIRDEQVSLECAVHLQVLVALAKNQTEDLSLRFKQLKVMEFLVHQISLEYEASQIATPRDVIRINKALASQLKSSSRSSGSKGILKGDSMSQRSQPSLDSSDLTTPPLKKGLSSLCPLHSPGKTRVFGKHLHAMSKDIPKLELGFLSVRDLGSVENADLSCESYLLSRPFTGRHEFLLKWQEVMKPDAYKLSADSLSRHHQESGGERKVSFHEEFHQQSEYVPPLVPDMKCIEEKHLPAEAAAVQKLVYSGRFFDLNEEVERELAEEDVVQDSDSDEDTTDESGERSSLGDADEDSEALRPCVPKLNLPKSARKDHESVGSHSTTATEAKAGLKLDKKSPGIPLSIDVATSNNSSKAAGVPTAYDLERRKRRLYGNSSLHLFLLELYISLMLTPQGTLDQSYSDRFQTEKQKLNAPFFLFYHLNHIGNAGLLPCLIERMRAYNESALRILRLSWTGLFNPLLYKNRVRIAHGAFSQIYKATFSDEQGPHLVVLKTIELPKGPYEPCKFFDVYSEVQILEKFIGEPKVCQLLDYGVEPEAFVLVLRHYKCSLRAWRLNQRVCFAPRTTSSGPFQKSERSFFERLPLFLEIYAAVLDAVKVLEMHNVVHYDLKCDNVLLEPTSSEEEFWEPVWPPANNSRRLPFRVCLTDFGQSKASIFQGGECTFRNRGTEYVKSPEMLKLLSSSSDLSEQPDESVGKAVDVWGLGCLLYELLAAEYLLYDEDWMRFFVRVTMQSEDLITKEKAAKVGNFAPVVDFIRFVLVRDPSRRPTLDEVMVHFKQLQARLYQPDSPESEIVPCEPSHTSTFKPASTSKPSHTEAPKPSHTEAPEPSHTEAPHTSATKPSKSQLTSWLCCGCLNRGASD